MLEKKRGFQLFYPDVLGTVTGGSRIHMDQLQVALGIFPRQAYINQPFEAVIVLQSLVNQPMQVKIAVRLPTTDKKGAPAVIDTPQSQVALNLKAGEVGVLRMPIIARPPTQPGKEFPVRLAVRFRVPNNAELIRPPAGGAPPATLEISPFKLQVLRDVEFRAQTWNESADIITGYFDLAPHRLTQTSEMPKMRYEMLWNPDGMAQERKMAKAHIMNARQLADSSAYPSSFAAFLDQINARFEERGMLLHHGEAMAIAKMMAYTVDEAPRMEQALETEETRWFTTLCQVLASDPELLVSMDRNELIAQYLFYEVLYEAILMGFHVIERRVTETLGSYDERIEYANSVLAWLGGRGAGELNYIYLPLVLGGLSITRLVRTSITENPWDIVDALSEALRERIADAHGETILVLDMLNTMLTQAAITLRNQRVERP